MRCGEMMILGYGAEMWDMGLKCGEMIIIAQWDIGLRCGEMKIIIQLSIFW